MTETVVAQVRIFSSARKTGKSFDYLCPADAYIDRGTLVSVPFGKSNRSIFGIVEKVSQKKPDMELKEILKVFPEDTHYSDEMLDMCEYMCKTYFCTFGDAAKCILPSPVYRKKDKLAKFVSISDGIDPLSCLSSFRGKNKAEYEKIIEYLRLCGTASLDTISGLYENAAASIRFLEKKGIIRSFFLKEERMPYDFPEIPEKTEIELSPEQQNAFDEIEKKYDTSLPCAVLLHGVTGSGKTSIALKMCDKVLSEGKTIIFLVPEIALTSQSAHILISRYGDKVALIHSALSDGERRDAITGIRSGDKKIVIGTRSAIFAPLDNLGLIVIDEEQDQSYKSDTAVKYHARDIARYRCAKNGAMLLMMSATPDIETYYKAKNEKYSLIKLSGRFGGNSLPNVEIADIRADLRQDPSRLIGKKLDAEIKKNLEDKKQTILLMNRRGYKRFISCTDCGEAIKCPNCSVSLTLHTGREKRLSCHYCGYTVPMPKKCPSCQNEHLLTHGAGIQQLEEEIKKFYPAAKVLRMDSDSISGKFMHDEIIEEFEKGNADILIGTQMVAKGHNFPLTTLVGIVMADSSLYLSDYRAYEHTFSLLTQVIGRAGRASDSGRAVIQTLNPRHNVFRLSSEQDYEKFYDGEIALRKSFLFPPFCDICVFTISDDNEKRLTEITEKFSGILENGIKNDFSDIKCVIYGPFDSTIYKIKNVYRKRFIIKYKNNPRTRAFFNDVLEKGDAISDSRTRLSIDINPSVI